MMFWRAFLALALLCGTANAQNRTMDIDTLTAAVVISKGTKFTASGCSNTTTLGGAAAGSFVAGVTGACTVTITINGATGATAPTGWSCAVSNQTTANLMRQSASTTTTATVTGTTVTSDVIVFSCEGF